MKQKFEESLPDYEQYKNMSCVVLGPKESSRKTPQKKFLQGIKTIRN